MTFAECMRNAVDGGEISQEDARRLEREFQRLRDQFSEASPVNADAEAKKALAELLKAESNHQRRKAKLAIKSIREIAADLGSYRNASGERDIAAAALDKLEHFGTARFSSVEGRRKSIIGVAHARMEDALYHFRRSAIAGDLARHNKADLDNVLREAFGENTGDEAAKHFAKVWHDTHEWLRQRFNAAGGAIGKLENWGLPQRHDARALRKAGLDRWKAFIRPLLDPARMKHPLTGKPIGAAELDDVLTGIWENIATEGWADRDPSRMARGKGSLANQRADQRVLIFRDADSWLAYQRDFGAGDDIFGVMMSHINGMAKDISAMEILGPNPNGAIEWIKQAVRKEAMLKAAGKASAFAGNAEKAMDRASGAERRIDDVWGAIRGNLETPVHGTFAAMFSGARTFITASVLGAASLSSVSDIGTSQIARQFAGIAANGAFRDIVDAMRPATRREAVAAGLILDSAMHVFHAQARYVGTLDGPGITSFVADRVLTYSGLTPWSQSARHAFGLAFMRTAAEQAGNSFEAMPAALRETFQRYGISPADWDKMRRMPLHDMGSGVKIMRPMEIAERIDERLAERFLEMIQAETEYAVPTGSQRARTALINQNRPGTLMGEVARSFAQFKSFGAVFAILYGQRIHGLLTSGQHARGAAFAGSLLISSMIYGGLALQLKSLAAGRDPRDIRDKAFWGAALLQGGGLGIYGDFLFANVNRYGGGFSTTLGGPLAQRASDAWNLTGGNLIQLAAGEDTHFGKEAVKFARGNIPGSNIWYMRLAWERLLMDQLQYLADPQANRAFKRSQQFFKREFGQDFWWAPGEAAPRRGPDLGTAIGR